MKKKAFLIVAAILTVALAAAALAACNGKGGGESTDVSRSVTALYVGESGAFAVSVETGMREDPFLADGKATEVKSFAEITVTPLKSNSCKEVTYTLSCGENTLNGTLAANTFGEFRQDVPLDFAPDKIAVTADGATEEIELQNVLDGKLTSSDVINIARKEFADRIAAESADGAPSREIYVKLISGDRETYYYYVSFIGEGVDYWAMLVNPSTGEIVSKK